MSKILEEVLEANKRYTQSFSELGKLASIQDGKWVDTGSSAGSPTGKYIEWLTIRDLAQSVVADVTRMRTHPLVPSSIPIYGFIYDVLNGKLIEVPAATSAGASEA